MLNLSNPDEGVLLYLIVVTALLLVVFLVKGRYWIRNLNNKYQDIPVIIMYAGAYIVLWVYSIGTGPLKSFGMPKDISDVESSKQVLYYLEMYNAQIVNNTEVLNQAIFITFLFLFTLVSTRWVRISENKPEH